MPQWLPTLAVVEVNGDDPLTICVGSIPSPSPVVSAAPTPTPPVGIGIAAFNHGLHADPVADQTVGLATCRLNALRRKVCGNRAAQAAFIHWIGDAAPAAVVMEGARPGKGVALRSARPGCDIGSHPRCDASTQHKNGRAGDAAGAKYLIDHGLDLQGIPLAARGQTPAEWHFNARPRGSVDARRRSRFCWRARPRSLAALGYALPAPAPRHQPRIGRNDHPLVP